MRGTPAAGSGARIIPLQELAQLMAGNAKAREAVNRINRFEGSPRLAEKIIHEDYKKNVTTVLNHKYQIDQAARKQRGVLA